MTRVHQRQSFSRNTSGPAVGAPGDGLEPGMTYSAVIREPPAEPLASATLKGWVPISVPALNLSATYQARITPGAKPVVGLACLAHVDEQKNLWVGTGVWKEGEGGEGGGSGAQDHSFSYVGLLEEATLPGLTVYGAGQELVAVDLRIESGTSIEAELQLNSGKLLKTKVTSGTPVRETLAQVLADKDYLRLLTSAIVGSPENLSYTFHVQ